MIIGVNGLKRFGYQPGGGLVDPSGTLFLLSIPKNASTFLTNTLVANGWQHSDLDLCRGCHQIAVMREPTERWISGIATYLTYQLFGWGYGSDHFIEQYNELTERLIFNRLIFDDHTEPQYTYIQQMHRIGGIILMEDDVLVEIEKLTGFELQRLDVEKNSGESNYDLNNLQRFFMARLGELQPELLRDVEGEYNPAESLRTRLQRVYTSDYNLYNTMRIHGTR